MREISVENIKWQRRKLMEPGQVWLPLEDEEAQRRGLPQFEIVQVPVKMRRDKVSSYVIQLLENRYDYKVSSFSIPEVYFQ